MLSNLEVSVVGRKCHSYKRFSGKRQEAGHSYQRQLEMAEQAAKAEGAPLDLTLTLDDKGLSAFRGENWKRGFLGKFIDLVDAGIIPPGDVLIIERVNRLSRLPWMEQVELWKEILRREIVIRTCEPPSRYTKENMNDLSVGCPVVLYMMLGHAESKQKSDWIKAVWAEKKKQAREKGVPHGRMRPAWIDVVIQPHPKNPARIVTTKYELNKERGKVVAWIFEQCIAGKGFAQIARMLREQGIPCFQRSDDWTHGSVRSILQSRETFGDYQPSERDPSGRIRPVGKPIAGYYPAAITEEIFNAAHAACRSRRGKGGRHGQMEVNLFTHLAYDADTETPLHSMTQSREGKVWRYLANQNRTQIVPYHAFEKHLLETLSQLKARDIDGRHEEDALTARVNALQDEYQRLQHELEALDLQIRELPPERWSKRVVARMGELEQTIASKREELRLAKEAANTSGRTDSLTDMQTSIELLAEVQGMPQEASVRQRLKMRIHLLVEGIMVKVQTLNKLNRYVHIWLYLHGSEQPRYFAIKLGRCFGTRADNWKDLSLKLPWRSERIPSPSDG